MTGDPGLSLRQRFLGGFAWTGSSRALMSFVGVAVTLVLARLLEPRDFGLLAMATIFTGLIEQTQALGVGAALIQKETVTPQNKKAAFTVGFAFAVIVYLALFFAARPIGLLYDEPRVIPILRVVALAFPLSAFTIVPRALLRRNLTLRGEAAANVSATLADSATTVSLAWAGYGVWSLVVGRLVSLVIQAIGLSFASPWRPAFGLRGGEVRSLLKFGGGMTLSGYLWYSYNNVDFFIIGKVLGSSVLGVYRMARNLAKMPLERIWTVINPLVLPLFSRARSDPDELARVLCQITRYNALVIFPLCAGLGAVADVAVPVLLGEKWSAAVGPIRLLAFYCAVRGVIVLLPPMLLSVGRVRQLVGFHLICLFVLPVGFIVGLRWGAVGIAFVWAVLYPLLAAMFLLPLALREAKLTLARYLNAFIRPATATLLMVAAVVAAGAFLPANNIWSLTARVLLGAAIYALVLRFLEGPLLAEIRLLVKDMRQGMRA